MRRSTLSARVLAGAICCVALSVGCSSSPPSSSPEGGATPEATRRGAPEECLGGAIVDHAFSASDDTDLVGFADNVFVGQVEKRVGSTKAESHGGPMGRTQFSVEVLKNVKGRLGGIVTVSQEGAYDPELGCVMLMEDDPLLKPGQKVMFFPPRRGAWVAPDRLGGLRQHAHRGRPTPGRAGAEVRASREEPDRPLAPVSSSEIPLGANVLERPL